MHGGVIWRIGWTVVVVIVVETIVCGLAAMPLLFAWSWLVERAARAGAAGRRRSLRRHSRQADALDADAPSARTVITGQGAARMTFSATLPSSKCDIPPRPCVPMTMRSIPRSRA